MSIVMNQQSNYKKVPAMITQLSCVVAIIISLIMAAGCAPPPPVYYTIGGTVTGLNEFSGESVFISMNKSAAIKIIANDNPFIFNDPVQEGNAYSVGVVSVPAGKKCTVSGGGNDEGAGVAASDVSNILIYCEELDIVEVNMPDAALLQCISDVVGGDLNVPVSTLTELTCLGPDQTVNGDYDIQDASGLEQFIYLQGLSLYGISISNINITTMKSLIVLRLFLNRLIDIDISQNLLLQELWLYNNYLVGAINLDDYSFLSTIYFQNNCWDQEAQDYYDNVDGLGYQGGVTILWSIRPDC